MDIVCHASTKLELGGAQEVAMRVVSNLDRRRFRPVLIAGDGGLHTGEAAALEGVEVRLIPSLLREIRPLQDLRALWELVATFRRLRPKIVHTHSSKAGELLKEKYPDKNYRVLMMSYGHSRPVSIKARPADNVVISIVANFFGRTGLVDRGSTRADTFREQFEGWAKIVPSMLWRPNTGSPAGWQQGLPDLSVQQTFRDLQAVAAARCEGIFIDSVWEHWATQGPQYYVMAQLVWDPQVVAQAELDDYYRRAFGPAATHVREYY